MCSCLQNPSSQPASQVRTVVSSGVTFQRCTVCGGWGKDLLLPSGLCSHCTRLTTGRTEATQSAQSAAQPVYSHVVDALMMQPQLRKYKQRPSSGDGWNEW